LQSHNIRFTCGKNRLLSGRLENTRELGNLKAEIAALRERQELIEDLTRRVRKLEEKVFA